MIWWLIKFIHSFKYRRNQKHRHILAHLVKVPIFSCSPQHCNFQLIQLKCYNLFPEVLGHFSLHQSRLLNSRQTFLHSTSVKLHTSSHRLYPLVVLAQKHNFLYLHIWRDSAERENNAVFPLFPLPDPVPAWSKFQRLCSAGVLLQQPQEFSRNLQKTLTAVKSTESTT